MKPHVSKVYPLAETPRALRSAVGAQRRRQACRSPMTIEPMKLLAALALVAVIGVADAAERSDRQVDRSACHARSDVGRVDHARRHYQLLCARREDRAEGRRCVSHLHQPAGRAGNRRVPTTCDSWRCSRSRCCRSTGTRLRICRQRGSSEHLSSSVLRRSAKRKRASACITPAGARAANGTRRLRISIAPGTACWRI